MAEDINRVVLVGRLTRDGELSYTNSGTALLKLGLAVNRRRKQGDQWVDEANFFDITIWGRRGESLSNYMTKGRQIAVDGQLRQDRWESQDGTKRSRVEIVADNINFVSAPRDGGGSSENRDPRSNDDRNAPPPASPPQGGGPASFEDDIPF